MFEVLRFLTRRSLLGLADFVVTTPLVRWTWTGLADAKFAGALAEFRLADPQSVRDMMAGRYLLAGKLVDTEGVSPFGMDIEHSDWRLSLHSFSWLRHFSDTRDQGERRFARTLVLDWIGRNRHFNAVTWAPALTSMRILNWLRHYPLIIEGANPDQTATIGRNLGSQIQSLRLRAGLSAEPLDALLAAIVLLGAGLCTDADEDAITKRLDHLLVLLDNHVDADGLYRNRSPRTQLLLLVELTSVHIALMHAHRTLAKTLTPRLQAMHDALDALTLGTGEPVYFHGSGQLPHDVLIAVQSQAVSRPRQSRVMGGYGILVGSDGVVVADGGAVPDLPYADTAHASALGFEFSQGRELIVGSCGPAPADLIESKLLFRKAITHSSPTIDDKSPAGITDKGALTGRLVPRGPASQIGLNVADQTLTLATNGYQSRFGIVLERRLTLLSEGKTLVGQDKIVIDKPGAPATCVIRFHLAPGAQIYPGENQDIVRIRLASNALWTFLWEGAEMHEEDSVRQSAHFGFHRTSQIVLQAPAENGREIAWIFTRDD